MFSIFEPDLPYQTRREWLRIGAGGLTGLTMPSLVGARPEQPVSSPHARRAGRARSCIVLWLEGGPAHHETWDPKPDAPAEVRGDLKPIASATPGLLVGELMPRTARITEKLTVLHAVTTGYTEHHTSAYYMRTGRRLRPGQMIADPRNDWPCTDAVVKWARKQSNTLSPVMLPLKAYPDSIQLPGQDAGFLGRAADPWLLDCDPNAADFEVPEMSLPADMPSLRFDQRRALLEQVNRHLDAVQRDNAFRAFDAQSQQAFDMLNSSQGRGAFDLSQEPTKLRDRYGRHRWGQSVLLARRLVEAGVPFVRVNWVRLRSGGGLGGTWDTHDNNTEGLKALMPVMDQTYSALLEDLANRGLLDQTLVVWMGDFGRTPRIGTEGERRLAGRDHWGHVFSVALAGGGVQGGRVIGCSDSLGAYPKDRPVRPEDLTATMFHCLGVPPETEIKDRQGRPLVISEGQVIQQLF